ncbi:hypothetical protein D3C85_1407930 [compost metagenome]
MAGAMIHDTCGSLPFFTSLRKAFRYSSTLAPGIVLAMPLYSGLPASSLAGS